MNSTTLNQRILDFARADGGKIFCHLKPTGSNDYLAISYAQLVHRAGDYVRSYRERGLPPGESVQLILEHGPDMIYAFVGALLGGYVPSYLAPISDKQDPQHYWSQLHMQSRHIGGNGLVVTTAGFKLHMLAVVGDMAVLTCEEVASQVATDATTTELPLDLPSVLATDIALLQHSSGTTGSRKGVALTHQAILQQIVSYAEALELTGQDVIVSWLPLYHDMGLISSFLMPLLTGTPVVLLSPFEWVSQPRLFLDAIEQFAGTLAWLPNFAFHFLSRLRLTGNPPNLSSIRALINCSEPCKKEAFDTFVDHFSGMGIDRSKLHICYAMAEMVFAATQTGLDEEVHPLRISRTALQSGLLSPHADGEDYVMPVGRPIAGVEVKIIGESDQEVRELADGEVGEIVLAAPFLFSGYYKNPQLTELAFCNAGYKTGDLGAKWRGDIYITGRKKDLIIVNGKNYYAHDVEAIAATLPGIKPGRCVAFGIYNNALGSEGIYLIAESDTVEMQDVRQLAVSIKAAIQQEMGVIITKAVVVPAKWLIKTTSGKISRKDNKEKYLASLSQIQQHESTINVAMSKP